MMEKVVSDENILSLCNVMKILNEANYWMNSEKLIVPAAEFYSEELSNSLDIKKEYQHWQNLIHPEIERYIQLLISYVFMDSYILIFDNLDVW